MFRLTAPLNMLNSFLTRPTTHWVAVSRTQIFWETLAAEARYSFTFQQVNSAVRPTLKY